MDAYRSVKNIFNKPYSDWKGKVEGGGGVRKGAQIAGTDFERLLNMQAKATKLYDFSLSGNNLV